VGFVDAARQAFGFLVTDHDFLGPRVDTGRAYVALEYTGRDVGVRIEFDAREEMIDVLFAPLVDGTWPARDEAGWVYLDRVADARGARLLSGVFRIPQTESDLNDRLQEEAGLLRTVGRDLLEGSSAALEQFRSRRDVGGA
jgi:hypothetical protein